MKWFYFSAAAALVGALGGCGGGGGGGGGGGLPFPILPAATLGVTVQVNGSSATANGDGKYSIKPGDVITVTPNLGSDWTSSSDPAGSVSLRNADISSTKWSAQIANNTNAASVFTVSAKATANAALTKDTVFNVAAGDARNLSYKVYATNGSQQTLALNFDTMSYVMTDETGLAVSDSFSADAAQTGTYVFKSSRNTAATNNSRFRLITDAVVGSFPFQVAQVPGSYAVQPFIGSRAIVTTQSALDGIYIRFGINMRPGVIDSQIRQVQVTGGGTSLLMCNEVGITSIAACPPASIATYAISAGSSAGSWSTVNVANASDKGALAVIMVDGKKVYVAAGINSVAPNDSIFRIGLVDSSTWLNTTARGGDNNGTWGTLGFDATTYTAALTKPDGTVSNVSYGLNVASASIPALKGINFAGTDRYFAMQDGTLSVVVGARTNPVTGYLQIGLVP
ncbi:hypothetical protein LJR260_003204 [Variovorax paradoxus]|uniref:Lipoprotein n=1 Tax=Variovorax paradoxus (strain S110) TaxID=543728 RepID=C5CS23_VARPS